MPINKNDLAKRLNKLLDINGYPQKNVGRITRFAKSIGVTPRASSQWLLGEVIPYEKNIDLICSIENCKKLWLETGQGEMRDKEDSLTVSLPVIALEHTYEYKKYLTTSPRENYDFDHEASENMYITKMNDDSMYPVFNKEAILFVDPDDHHYTDGCFIIAHIKNDNEVIVRNYLKATNNTVFLTAFNHKFQPYQLNNDIKIIGKIMQSISKY